MSIPLLADTIGHTITGLRRDLMAGGWPYDRQSDTVSAETAISIAPNSTLAFRLERLLRG